MQAPPPMGYLEIEHALRLLELGESDWWIAGKLEGVDHRQQVKPWVCCSRAAARKRTPYSRQPWRGWREHLTATGSPGFVTPECDPP